MKYIVVSHAHDRLNASEAIGLQERRWMDDERNHDDCETPVSNRGITTL